MIQIAIVDDEETVCQQLKELFEKYQQKSEEKFQITLYRSGVAFLGAEEKEYDVIFLDIEMPYMNGIETAKNIRIDNPNVTLVFVTNMAQYAIAGYDVNAVDYIVKPLSYETFEFKMQRILNKVKQLKRKKYVIKMKGGYVCIDTSDIYYIEVMKHELVYHTAKGNYITYGTMNMVEEQLKEKGFVRSSSSYLLNMQYVEGFENDDVIVKGDKVRLSSQRKQAFFHELMQYMGGRR